MKEKLKKKISKDPVNAPNNTVENSVGKGLKGVKESIQHIKVKHRLTHSLLTLLLYKPTRAHFYINIYIYIRVS